MRSYNKDNTDEKKSLADFTLEFLNRPDVEVMPGQLNLFQDSEEDFDKEFWAKYERDNGNDKQGVKCR